MEKGVVMEDVYIKLLEYDEERIIFTYTDDNSKNLIGRISLRIDKDDNDDNKTSASKKTSSKKSSTRKIFNCLFK